MPVKEQRKIIGGVRADASVNCADGSTISCSGTDCYANDPSAYGPGNCSCDTAGGGYDNKECPKPKTPE